MTTENLELLNLENLTPEQQLKLYQLLKTDEEHKKHNKINEYFPDIGPYSREKYPKHLQFFKAGKDYMQRAFIAGNQTGKTLACAFETSLHLTGLYPDWWEGRRFDHPIKAWAAGVSAARVKETIQDYLLGSIWDIGSGMIPAECIVDTTSSASQVSGLKADIIVKHYTNGIHDGNSVISLKSYTDEREKFQGSRLDLIWMDEEDKKGPGIYKECLTRFATTGGMMICSFTPLYSLTEVVLSFIPALEFAEGGCGETKDPEGKLTNKFVANATWDDIPHLNEASKEMLLKEYRPEERNARTRGIPGLGAGLIYPVEQRMYTFTPNKELMQSLQDLPRAYAMDIAYTSGVTAAVWGYYDEHDDTWWIYDEYYCSGMPPVVHAEAIKQKGSWIEGVVDPSSERQVKAGDDLRIIDEYRNRGLLLEKARNTLYAGIDEVYNRFVTGRLKISIRCEKLLWELKQYRKDEKGQIVDMNDHACDCLRYLVMSGSNVLGTKPPDEEDDDPDTNPWARRPRFRDRYTGY
jgi:phage terminase large subunit-like protein